jgi:hypothetical protein
MLPKSATAAAVSGSAQCVLAVPSNVAYWGQSGKHVLDLRFTAFDPERTLCLCATLVLLSAD